MKKAYLLLENGKRFEGVAIGATEGAIGELVFTTGVCGYIETLTDPAYYGQIVMQTFPLIGNYGMIPSDVQGKCALAGYVVRDICDEPSNFRAETPLEEFLRANGIPGIAGSRLQQKRKFFRAAVEFRFRFYGGTGKTIVFREWF